MKATWRDWYEMTFGQVPRACHMWKTAGLSYTERVLWEQKDKETSKPKLSI